MPNDYFKRIDTSKIYPKAMEKFKLLADSCNTNPYYAISGFRSVDEQNELYAQGRTKPGAIVTKAKGGQSNHNFGIAIDFCHDIDITREGLQPDWAPASYMVLAEEAKHLNLEPGYYWAFKDTPHIQLPIGKYNIKGFSSDPKEVTLLSIYNKGGLPAVWAYLDKFEW
jgi:peptidoglycan L-alanyl-D-glutamate endopeptidase CwlK